MGVDEGYLQVNDDVELIMEKNQYTPTVHVHIEVAIIV